MKKGNLIFIIGVVLIIVGTFIFANNYNKRKSDYKKTSIINKKDENLLSGKYYAEIKVKDYGKIKLELDADEAPITVTNFVNLVNEGFYDGLTFHRIIEGFMIQGGGYEEDGSRKPASSIKGEFTSNNVKNTISHKRGVISMARATNKNSASSEFFIMHADNFGLDGNYAAFGKVINGMDIVDKIATKAKPIDNNGSINIDERPVIEYIKMIEE